MNRKCLFTWSRVLSVTGPTSVSLDRSAEEVAVAGIHSRGKEEEAAAKLGADFPVLTPSTKLEPTFRRASHGGEMRVIYFYL